MQNQYYKIIYFAKLCLKLKHKYFSVKQLQNKIAKVFSIKNIPLGRKSNNSYILGFIRITFYKVTIKIKCTIIKKIFT